MNIVEQNSTKLSGPDQVFPSNFVEFIIAKRTHFPLLRSHSVQLYGEYIDFDDSDLKRYQDLLAFAFIKANMKPGAKILEVGGGDSRVLRALSSSYECWNIDPLEGVGNGPKAIKNCNYRLVRDYMGKFNTTLPKDYFDLVFSISALEHVSLEEKEIDDILADINRVLTPGGYSLHLLDTVLGKNGVSFLHPFLPRSFQQCQCFGNLPDKSDIFGEPDIYCMSKLAYDRGWLPLTKRDYQDFGRPTSVQVLWQK